ncbi:MAG: Yip1 family protein, partial [Acidiferrobacteraceae bacterium]
MEKLLSRLRGLLFAPRATWATIAAEQTTPSSLYRDWIAWLVAITPVSVFIGLSVFGLSLPFAGTVRVGAGALLLQMLVSYVLALVVVYLVALLAVAISPAFGGYKDNVQALKLVAYAWTPVWVAGVLHLIPAFGVLAAVAEVAALIYSVWLLWVGAQSVLTVPQDRAAGFTAVLIVIGVILAIAVGAASAALSGTGAMAPGAGLPFSAPHRASLPGSGLASPALQDAMRAAASAGSA